MRCIVFVLFCLSIPVQGSYCRRRTAPPTTKGGNTNDNMLTMPPTSSLEPKSFHSTTKETSMTTKQTTASTSTVASSTYTTETTSTSKASTSTASTSIPSTPTAKETSKALPTAATAQKDVIVETTTAQVGVLPAIQTLGQPCPNQKMSLGCLQIPQAPNPTDCIGDSGQFSTTSTSCGPVSFVNKTDNGIIRQELNCPDADGKEIDIWIGFVAGVMPLGQGYTNSDDGSLCFQCSPQKQWMINLLGDTSYAIKNVQCYYVYTTLPFGVDPLAPAVGKPLKTSIMKVPKWLLIKEKYKHSF